MKLLAIETATEACSVALVYEGGLIERYQLAPREHAALVLPMIQELLSEAGLSLQQLDAIAFGRGPGSFTGVRIAASVTQGLAYAAGLPVVPVSTLAALAQGALRESAAKAVIAAIDARMEEIYWGVYRESAGVMQVQCEERVCPPADAPAVDGNGYLGVGSGWMAYGEVLQQRYAGQLQEVRGERFPRAADIAALAQADYAAGKAVAAEQAQPVYLRDRVTHQRSGRSG